MTNTTAAPFTYGSGEPCYPCHGSGMVGFVAPSPADSWDDDCRECGGEGFLPHGEATAYGIGTDYGTGSDDDLRAFLPESDVAPEDRPDDLHETFVPDWDREAGYGHTVTLTAYVPAAMYDSHHGEWLLVQDAASVSGCRGEREHYLLGNGWPDDDGEVCVMFVYDLY